MVTAIWPVVCVVLGLLVWALAKNQPIVSEAGKWTFVIGLLYLVGALAHSTLTLGG